MLAVLAVGFAASSLALSTFFAICTTTCLLLGILGILAVNGDAEGCDVDAVRRRAHLRIGDETADEDSLVVHLGASLKPRPC